ncbi:MAG: hypothetical protein AB7T49_02225 [Oligoflexales bacterium]
MKHLFVIDPLTALNLALDTSLHISQALMALGEDVYLCQPSQLFLQKTQNVLYGQVRKLLKFDSGDRSEKITLSDDLILPVREFSSVHMRKDPPFDTSYIMVTWMLDFVPSVTVLNSPTALRSLNEKLLILRFPHFCADALFSANPDQLLEFAERTPAADAILKPIDLFGGRGVLRLDLNKTPRKKIYETLVEETRSGTLHRLIQPFNPSIFDGEVRAFYAGSEAIAWCLKKPRSGNFLANTREGATLHSFEPSKDLLTKTNHVAKALLKEGVYFVGFDVIGEEISEINITSPRLLASPGGDKSEYYKTIAVKFMETLKG